MRANCSTNLYLWTPYLWQVQYYRWQVQCDPYYTLQVSAARFQAHHVKWQSGNMMRGGGDPPQQWCRKCGQGLRYGEWTRCCLPCDGTDRAPLLFLLLSPIPSPASLSNSHSSLGPPSYWVSFVCSWVGADCGWGSWVIELLGRVWNSDHFRSRFQFLF